MPSHTINRTSTKYRIFTRSSRNISVSIIYKYINSLNDSLQAGTYFAAKLTFRYSNMEKFSWHPIALVEMPHHGEGSLCCGVGGGRMWQDLQGDESK
jgi:hypothetical protein